jgi:hypothetical protein
MFTSKPIGFVSSPYKNTSEIPKGLGAKHDAEGVLKIVPEFGPGLTDIEAFHISSSCGSLIILKGSSCSAGRLSILGLMACLPPALPVVRIRSD